MLVLLVSTLTFESVILYASVQKELYAFVNGLIAYDYIPESHVVSISL